MPTFNPPVSGGTARATGNHHGDKLMRHYGETEEGSTVWKDSLGLWHVQQYPYQGGETYRAFDDGELIFSSGPAEGLATAQKVYLGGHVYTITDAEAVELVSAGFGPYITDLTIPQATGDAEVSRWISLIRNVGVGIPPPTLPSWTYEGGDVTDACLTSGGPYLWIGADWFAGASVDLGDNTYNSSPLPFRSNAILEQPIGTFGAQLHAVGDTGNWLVPDQVTYPGRHYWPICVILDGTTVRVGCWLVDGITEPPTPFGQLEDSHIVQVNAFGGQDFAVPLRMHTDFWLDGMVADGGFFYLYGEQFNPPYERGYATGHLANSHSIKRVARTTSLTSPVLTFWNGTTWGPRSEATPLVDESNRPIQGDAGVWRIGPNDFMLAASRLVESAIRLYTSTTPQGPWTFRTSVAAPIIGAAKNGGIQVGQLTKIIPHVPAPANHVQVLTSRNNLFATNAFSDRNIDTYCPLFTTVPIFHAT